MAQPPWKTVWRSLTKQSMLLPYNPATALLGIYPKGLKTSRPHKTYTQMCTGALVTISKIQKEPRCPSVGESINKFWHIHTLEYYSGLKRNELSSHEKTWRKFNCISLSERYQSEKATYYTIPILRHSRKGKTMKTVKRAVVAGEG